MAREIPDTKTPATKEQIVEALWRAWLAYFGSPPRKESVWVMGAQWALESGWGKSCHCWNLGNVKSREGDGYDYCYFACNEILPTKQAHNMAAAAPETAKVTSDRADGKSIIWFYPKHPGCRFRAFDTLLDGATDHVSLLFRRFHLSWEGVEQGDPALFAHLLKQQGYYTADESSYVKAITGTFKVFQGLQVDYDALPILTEQEKDRLSNLVALGMSLSPGEILTHPRPDDDEE